MRKATAAGVFTLAGGDRIPAEVLYRQEDSEKKKKEGGEEEWLSKGSTALCVNTYKERWPGPLYRTVSKQRARQLRSVFKALLLNKNTAADHNIKIICVIFMLWRCFKNEKSSTITQRFLTAVL